jgi:hypothetical protein
MRSAPADLLGDRFQFDRIGDFLPSRIGAIAFDCRRLVPDVNFIVEHMRMVDSEAEPIAGAGDLPNSGKTSVCSGATSMPPQDYPSLACTYDWKDAFRGLGLFFASSSLAGSSPDRRTAIFSMTVFIFFSVSARIASVPTSGRSIFTSACSSFLKTASYRPRFSVHFKAVWS